MTSFLAGHLASEEFVMAAHKVLPTLLLLDTYMDNAHEYSYEEASGLHTSNIYLSTSLISGHTPLGIQRWSDYIQIECSSLIWSTNSGVLQNDQWNSPQGKL